MIKAVASGCLSTQTSHIRYDSRIGLRSGQTFGVGHSASSSNVAAVEPCRSSVRGSVGYLADWLDAQGWFIAHPIKKLGIIPRDHHGISRRSLSKRKPSETVGPRPRPERRTGRPARKQTGAIESRAMGAVRPHPQPNGTKPSFWWTLFVVDPEALGVNAEAFCEMVQKEGVPAFAKPQRNIMEWEIFRRLHGDPKVFRSYRPGRLKVRAFPLDACPNARTFGERVAAIRMTQHNTVGEAKAAARAVRKVAGVLLGRKV